MRFIDINCMIGEWGFKNLRFKTVEGLISEMDRLGINQAFVYDTKAWLYDQKTGNECTIASLSGNIRLIPVMVLTSLVEQEFNGREGILRFIRNNKIGAVRLFPFDHNYTLNLWNVEKLFDLMSELKMPVLIECKGMLGSIEPYFSQLYDICKQFEDVPIILLNPGYRNTRIYYELLEKCHNLYLDSSTLIPFRGIEDIVKIFGSDRIIYGSRMPFMDGGASLGRIIYSDLSENEKENISSNNILKLLKKIKY